MIREDQYDLLSRNVLNLIERVAELEGKSQPSSDDGRQFELEVVIRTTPAQLRNIASMLEDPKIKRVNVNWYQSRYCFTNTQRDESTALPSPGGHHFKNDVCECGQKITDDPVRCPLR